MRTKPSHEYICLNEQDKKFLEEDHLETLLDAHERKNVPIRTANIRKSIEHHLERQRLKRHIADFDWEDDSDNFDAH